MAKKSKQLPIKRFAYEHTPLSEHDKGAIGRLLDRLSRPDKEKDGSGYFAVNHSRWSSSIAGVRDMADQRQGEPVDSDKPTHHNEADGDNRESVHLQ